MGCRVVGLNSAFSVHRLWRGSNRSDGWTNAGLATSAPIEEGGTDQTLGESRKSVLCYLQNAGDGQWTHARLSKRRRHSSRLHSERPSSFVTPSPPSLSHLAVCLTGMLHNQVTATEARGLDCHSGSGQPVETQLSPPVARSRCRRAATI